MVDYDEGPKMSQLSRTVTHDGKKLQIAIYSNGAGKWLLECIDEENTSTAWEEPFETEQDALDEALNTLKEQGMEYFTGAPRFNVH